MSCPHNRRGSSDGYFFVYCKDCRSYLFYDWDEGKWVETGRKNPPFLCRIGLHKFCRHPMIKSDVVKNDLVYVCTDCGLEHEHDHVLGKWYPKTEEKRCLRCNTVKTP